MDCRAGDRRHRRLVGREILKGTGFGRIGDVVVGIVGGVICNWLWDVLRFPPIGGFWIISVIVTSTVGAIVLLILWRLIRR
jgi:uncharacterized membrane protein YeaQ/YmgE (transglycosylase-associated protein family)